MLTYPDDSRGVAVTYRTTAARALIAVGALTVVAACASSPNSGGSSSGGTAGAPVHGGNLVIARTADSQSMNNTTVFDRQDTGKGQS